MTGAVKLVTPADAEPVTKAEAKLWLRIDEHQVDEDALILSLIRRARERFEAITNRSCLIQEYAFAPSEQIDSGCAVPLPVAPLVSVVSIKGYQTSDADDAGGTAMSTDGYYVDTMSEFGRVVPVSGFTYPIGTREINPVIFRFTAGYSSMTTGVPDSVKTEIKSLVARLYEHRGDEVEMNNILDAYGCSELELPTWG